MLLAWAPGFLVVALIAGAPGFADIAQRRGNG
jgi:uncharacterized membrane protein YtjA (UPF0391 family)